MGILNGLFPGRKLRRELQELQRKAEQEPKNLHLRIRIGDLLARMGQKKEALAVYRDAAERYAQGGFLIQAIALNKLILRLDPEQVPIQEVLAGLYVQRGLAEEEAPAASSAPRPRAAIPLFSDLGPEELSRVMERIQARPFARGALICREGEPGDSIYIISSGKVGVFRQNVRNEREALNELGPGEFFGEFGFFADSRRHATVEALEDTELLEITKQDCQEVLREFPHLSEVLLKFYKERVLDTLLATSTVFHSLTPKQRREILDRFTLQEFSAGAQVLREGEAGDALYVIKKGEVEVYASDLKGAERILARMGEGDFFGEISLLTGRPRTASVRALEKAELLRLAQEDLDPVLSGHPEVRKVLEEALFLRLEDKFRALGVFRDSPAKEGMV